MENTNTVSIPLVDILSELTGKRVVMSGDDYVIFETLEKVSKEKIDAALILKEQKEKELSVPSVITKLQAMKQLKAIGRWEEVKALLSSNDEINDEWILSNELNRKYPLIISMGTALGLTQEDLDNIFIQASRLQ